jgi:NO-binding membrane sensor protein with MHYT domain
VRALTQITVALVVAVVAVFFGMVLPGVTDFEVHNPLWELIFGIGFGIAELFHIGMRGDTLIGFLLWPAFIFIAVWFAAFFVVRGSRRRRLVLAAVFIVSLLVCVGRDIQKSIAVHVPLWSNEYFVRY